MSKFQIIENLIDLSPLQLSQCDDGGHLDYNIARFVFLFSSLFVVFEKAAGRLLISWDQILKFFKLAAAATHHIQLGALPKQMLSKKSRFNSERWVISSK